MGWDTSSLLQSNDTSLEEKLTNNAITAINIFHILPDIVESLNGIWIGKYFSGIGDIFRFYEVDDEKRVFELILICIEETRKHQEKEKKKNKNV